MKWLIMVVIALVAIIVGISLYLQPNSFTGCTDEPTDDSCKKADAIVVVSGGDTQARTAEGIELYKQGWADYLVLSGAAQDKTGPSNAAAMKVQAQAADIPDTAILIDEKAVNTMQNAENVHSIFEDRGFTDLILVTSGYHQRRASLEFNKRTEGVTIRNHPLINDSDWSWFWWVTPRGWWLAGGEIVKIIGFYAGVSS